MGTFLLSWAEEGGTGSVENPSGILWRWVLVHFAHQKLEVVGYLPSEDTFGSSSPALRIENTIQRVSVKNLKWSPRVQGLKFLAVLPPMFHAVVLGGESRPACTSSRRGVALASWPP